jgi:hypothetical protein
MFIGHGIQTYGKATFLDCLEARRAASVRTSNAGIAGRRRLNFGHVGEVSPVGHNKDAPFRHLEISVEWQRLSGHATISKAWGDISGDENQVPTGTNGSDPL